MKLLKLLSILLLVALPVAAQAQFEYTTNADGSSVTVIGYGGPSVAAVIPGSFNGYAVTGIGQDAFDLYGVSSLSIPASITNIAGEAFSNSYFLASFSVSTNNPAYSSSNGVLFDKAQDLLIAYPQNSTRLAYTIPNSVTRIGDSAFYYSYYLNSVTIPDSVTNIGESAFYQADLTSVTIPSTVTSIGKGAFVVCPITNFSVNASNLAYSSLNGVLFDKAQDSLIAYPYGLTNRAYTIPNSVTSLEEKAFYGCELTSLVIPNGVTNIPGSAFSASELISVTLPGTLISIGDDAFTSCFSLTNINIPSSVTSIGDYAFFGCDLTNVSIPSGVTNIGDNAFVSLSLTNFSVDAGNPAYSSLNGVLFDKAQDLLIQFPEGLTNQAYNIPDSVTSIGKFAFAECSGLTGITIPDSVIRIGNSAFVGCTDLTNIVIPSSITSIGEGAFALCYNLTSIAIPSSVINIESNTFSDCSGLTNVAIPNSVTNIGVKAFYSCERLANVILPESIINIASNAFAESGLTSVTIPNSFTNIGNGAFAGCYALTNVIIPGNVIAIGNSAFSGCVSLTSVTISDSVTSIGEFAFSGCASLTRVTIPDSVTSLGMYAFSDCSLLTSIYFRGNAPPDDGTAFDSDHATVFRLPGPTGWGATFGGLLTHFWYLPNPEFLGAGPLFGVQSNQFGFTVSGPPNGDVVVQAAADLADPVWISIATNSLTNGTFYFSDSDWTNYPGRFYRFTAP